MNPRTFELLLPSYPFEADQDYDYDGRWRPNLYERIIQRLNDGNN